MYVFGFYFFAFVLYVNNFRFIVYVQSLLFTPCVCIIYRHHLHFFYNMKLGKRMMDLSENEKIFISKNKNMFIGENELNVNEIVIEEDVERIF